MSFLVLDLDSGVFIFWLLLFGSAYFELLLVMLTPRDPNIMSRDRLGEAVERVAPSSSVLPLRLTREASSLSTQRRVPASSGRMSSIALVREAIPLALLPHVAVPFVDLSLYEYRHGEEMALSAQELYWMNQGWFVAWSRNSPGDIWKCVHSSSRIFESERDAPPPITTEYLLGVNQNTGPTELLYDMSFDKVERMMREPADFTAEFMCAEGLFVACMALARTHLQKKVFLGIWLSLVLKNSWITSSVLEQILSDTASIDEMLTSDGVVGGSPFHKGDSEFGAVTVRDYAHLKWVAICNEVYICRNSFARKDALAACAPPMARKKNRQKISEESWDTIDEFFME